MTPAILAIKAALLTAALNLPMPYYKGQPPETRAQYEQRLEVIAEGIAVETAGTPVWGHRRMAATVFMVWWHESRFAVEVHAGTRHPAWTQDDGRARCMGQLHVSGIVPPRDWARLAGTDLAATRRCAAATMRVLAAQARRCSGAPLAGVLGAYGRGHGCGATESSTRRARRVEGLLGRI